MKAIWLGFLILMALALPGQHPYFYHLNEEDYLPSNEIYDIIQDDFGYLWIGCDAGLFRYDGFRYRHFRFSGQSNLGISNLEVRPGQEVWCQNFSGQIFHKMPGEDSLRLAYDASASSSTYPDYCLDAMGRAWLATDTLLLVIDRSHEVVKRFPISQMGSQLPKWHALAPLDSAHMSVISYNGRLFSINVHTYQVQELSPAIPDPSRFIFYRLDDRLILLHELTAASGKRYRFYAVNLHGVEYLGESDGRRVAAPGPEFSILNIEQVGSRTFLATTLGAIEVDDRLLPRKGGLRLFPDQKISSLFMDREGSLWCSSLQDGIFIVPNLGITVYNHDNSGLTDNSISTIWGRDEQSLLVGTYAGRLFELDLASQEISPLFANDPKPYRAVRKIEMHRGQLYVARGPFTVIDERGNIEVIAPLSNTRDFQLRGDTIFYARSDQCGYLLEQEGEWKNTLIREKGGRALATSPSGKGLCIMFTDGLYEWENGNLTELKYQNRPVNGNTMVEQEGEVWIGTLDQGILAYDGQGFRRLFSAGNGLKADEVKKILVRGKRLFAATRKGLSIIDLESGASRQVDEFDGFAYKEATGMHLVGGALYLSTLKGLVKLPVDIESENRVAPSIKIDGLGINGRSLPVSDSLDMSYSDVNLEVSLSSTAMRSRGHYLYAYRMQHLSDEWYLVPANQNKLNFASLPPGNYRLQVAAINEDGNRSALRTLAITVRSPFWEKSWFYLLLSVAFALLATLFFIYRLRVIRRKSEAKNRLIASQLTALKAQMNPHFMFNTLNSLQDLILKQDFKSTNYYLSKYASLMRMILSNSEKEEIDIRDEVAMLDLYLQLEKLRFGEEFEYSITGHPKPEQISASLPPMIIQPYVENAIKHGLLHKKGKKVLEIRIEEGEKQVLCTITDNGIGRQRSGEINARQRPGHESFSSGATSKRIELLQKIKKGDYRLLIEDLYEGNEPSGTRVVIAFPI